ncbi:thioredoxin [candidate division WWE3 bacterium RIFCSPHIGHO2_01_FULL_40_23]|uniref:Thioredoxin n=1 Tax=candidate division WWE3 bacterium RIFCSPLOWO2_01_FULL_41_18 TaxID=1802625 RepID=A0A1F4VDL4_UNCKA|nr:MAG: thioredoxin [candidate division WWE3 bacterium RIFCSPHIGHO2_01_FULL_40_23]OGC55249.1 MAG: thioredoxin [candidate division WWE3 bacterium RIFCSPLOWO2_01_FULL_41_18]
MFEFIDFFADWCGPCHAMKPIIEEAEKLYAGKIKFSKIDVDTNGEAAGKYGVMSIPTYVILKDEKEIDRKIGAMTRDMFKNWLDSVLAK